MNFWMRLLIRLSLEIDDSLTIWVMNCENMSCWAALEAEVESPVVEFVVGVVPAGLASVALLGDVAAGAAPVAPGNGGTAPRPMLQKINTKQEIQL